MEQIKAGLPPSIDNENDELILAGSNKDGAVVNDFYNMMATHEDEKKIEGCRKIWKVKVQEKVKSFAWVLGHNRLLTNLQKSHKGLGDTTCKLYRCVCESTMHVFMDYPKAMHIWMNKFPRNIVVEFYQLELVNWMNMHFNDRDDERNTWSRFWAKECHNLRRWRNNE